jgi:predicted ABC-type transport system involved in lysophospholipase L1 biosynthesis ATPase subunit
VAVETLNGEALQTYRARQVGFVFQEHRLLPQLTAIENVLIPTLARGCQAHTKSAVELLEMVGVAHRSDAFAWQMSGGERQRVAIARALVNSPRVLLCDEPTGNLDRENAVTIGDLLQSVAATTGTPVVIVTHNSELAAKCQRQLRLMGGRLAEPQRS